MPAVIILFWIYGGVAGLYSSAYDYFVPPKSFVGETLKASLVTNGSQMPVEDRLKWSEAVQALHINAVEMTISSPAMAAFHNAAYTPGARRSKFRIAEVAGNPTCLSLDFRLDPHLTNRAFSWKGRLFPQADLLLELWMKKQGRFTHHWDSFVDWKGMALMPLEADLQVDTAMIDGLSLIE